MSRLGVVHMHRSIEFKRFRRKKTEPIDEKASIFLAI